jgi:hypothetical protein
VVGRRPASQVPVSTSTHSRIPGQYSAPVYIHTLPSPRSAAQIWPNTPKRTRALTQPAYQKLLADGVLDRCGITLLAGKAIGAPFVGAVAASLVIAELLRLLHGGALTQLIDLDLQWPEHRIVVPQARDFSAFNPGYLPCAA